MGFYCSAIRRIDHDPADKYWENHLLYLLDIVTYPVDTAIQRLNNRRQKDKKRSMTFVHVH